MQRLDTSLGFWPTALTQRYSPSPPPPRWHVKKTTAADQVAKSWHRNNTGEAVITLLSDGKILILVLHSRQSFRRHSYRTVVPTLTLTLTL